MDMIRVTHGDTAGRDDEIGVLGSGATGSGDPVAAVGQRLDPRERDPGPVERGTQLGLVHVPDRAVLQRGAGGAKLGARAQHRDAQPAPHRQRSVPRRRLGADFAGTDDAPGGEDLGRLRGVLAGAADIGAAIGAAGGAPRSGSAAQRRAEAAPGAPIPPRHARSPSATTAAPPRGPRTAARSHPLRRCRRAASGGAHGAAARGSGRWRRRHRAARSQRPARRARAPAPAPSRRRPPPGSVGAVAVHGAGKIAQGHHAPACAGRVAAWLEPLFQVKESRS